MDKAYISERLVVERYLQGKLVGDELTTFEIHMLDHPEIVDDIEYARGLQQAIHGAKDELRSGESSQSQARSGFWLGRGYAMAATVLLAVTIAFSGYLYQRIDDLNDYVADLQNPLPVADEIWLEPLRGNRERVIVRRKDMALMLRVDVSATPAASYTAELRGEEARFVWARSQINPDDEQSIRLLLHTLPPGEYRLSVSADDGARPRTPFADYQFSLEEPED